MYSLSQKKEYVNPYRHGVNIGNFVEDIIAQDLVSMYKRRKPDYSMYLSETRDKYCDPSLLPNKNIKAESNRKPNFDLNIDFSKRTMKDINDQIEQNIINNNNRMTYLTKTMEKKKADTKDSLLASEVSHFLGENKDNKMEDYLCNSQRDSILSKYSAYSLDVQKQIGTQTDKFIKKDLVGLYFTTRSGQANHLLRGHGPFQNNWVKTENISVKE